MTIQELTDKHNQLLERKDECEREACEHERKAREKRLEMNLCKSDALEIRQRISEAANQQAAAQTAASAKAAQASAEQVAQSLLAKEKEIDAKLKSLTDLEAKLKAKE